MSTTAPPKDRLLRLGRLALVAGMLALAVGACGRRGPLEPPPNAKNGVEMPEDTQTQSEIEASSNTFMTSTTGKPVKNTRAIKPPKRDFVLDPLL